MQTISHSHAFHKFAVSRPLRLTCNRHIRTMRTVPLSSLLSSMQSGTALLGLCFTPQRIDLAITTLKVLQPRQLPQAPSLDADGLLRLVKEKQVLRMPNIALFTFHHVTRALFTDWCAPAGRLCAVPYKWSDSVWCAALGLKSRWGSFQQHGRS